MATKESGDNICVYYCKENDNVIRVKTGECGSIDEIQVGCADAPSYGHSVVGFNDLRSALSIAGYKIVKCCENDGYANKHSCGDCKHLINGMLELDGSFSYICNLCSWDNPKDCHKKEEKTNDV